MPEKVLKSPDLGFLEKRGDPVIAFDWKGNFDFRWFQWKDLVRIAGNTLFQIKNILFLSIRIYF